jgi:hypothetical protein
MVPCAIGMGLAALIGAFLMFVYTRSKGERHK